MESFSKNSISHRALVLQAKVLRLRRVKSCRSFKLDLKEKHWLFFWQEIKARKSKQQIVLILINLNLPGDNVEGTSICCSVSKNPALNFQSLHLFQPKLTLAGIRKQTNQHTDTLAVFVRCKYLQGAHAVPSRLILFPVRLQKSPAARGWSFCFCLCLPDFSI